MISDLLLPISGLSVISQATPHMQTYFERNHRHSNDFFYIYLSMIIISNMIKLFINRFTLFYIFSKPFQYLKFYFKNVFVILLILYFSIIFYSNAIYTFSTVLLRYNHYIKSVLIECI